VDADLVARVYENRYTARASVNRAKDRGIETARDASAEVRYDRFFTRTVFANASALFTSDRFRDLELRSNLGFGIGVQLADNPRAKISVESGYGYVNEQYVFELEPDRSYSALREATSAELYLIARRIVLFHRNDTFLSLADSTQTQLGRSAVRNINAQLHDGVRIGLGMGLVMTLQYDVDYVRSPAAGRKNTDRRSGLTFGYRF
jgi:putative salt-induced outer membrane protein YdiY